jgi:hypothetical protein
MAIDLIDVSKMDDQTAIQEVASAGLNSMEHLIYVLSHQAGPQSLDCREITDFTISKFKRVISILSRTGTPGSTAKPCPLGDIVTTSNCSKPPPLGIKGWLGAHPWAKGVATGVFFLIYFLFLFLNKKFN